MIEYNFNINDWMYLEKKSNKIIFYEKILGFLYNNQFEGNFIETRI